MSMCVCRSPPRPSPGGLHYSDEDICNNYNGAVLTESTTLTEKHTEVSESEVSVCRSVCLSLCLSLSLSVALSVCHHLTLITASVPVSAQEFNEISSKRLFEVA